MDKLNENANKLRAYAGVADTPEIVDLYGHDLSLHDGLRQEYIQELKHIVGVIRITTLPVQKSIREKISAFVHGTKQPVDKHSQVHELSETMLIHLKVVANPNQQAWVRGVATLEFMHAYADMLVHIETLKSFDDADKKRLKDIYVMLTTCLERTPGHLLMPAKELHVYGIMLPTGILVPQTHGLEFSRAYDRNRTRMEKVNNFYENILSIDGYLKSNSDPYSWLTWSMLYAKADATTGLWAGAIIVETLKKVCNPTQVALAVLACRSGLDYLAANGQIEETIHPLEGCEIPEGLLHSLTELREEPGNSRWGIYKAQGARHFALLDFKADICPVALKLPVDFMLDYRTCVISPNTVNAVANYVRYHVKDENEIVLQTLLREGWRGSFQDLVIVSNSL